MQFRLTGRIGRVDRIGTRAFVKTPTAEQAGFRLIAPRVNRGPSHHARQDNRHEPKPRLHFVSPSKAACQRRSSLTFRVTI